MGVESKEEHYTIKNNFKELLFEEKGPVEIYYITMQKL